MESIDQRTGKAMEDSRFDKFFSSKIIHFVSDFISMENMEDGEEY